MKYCTYRVFDQETKQFFVLLWLVTGSRELEGNQLPKIKIENFCALILIVNIVR